MHLINILIFKKSLRVLLIRMISIKSRNNSKLEGGPSANTAYGSSYKIVSSLFWMSEKNGRN